MPVDLTIILTWVKEERDVPIPGPGEVQIAIQATGLCGSDLHYYTHGRNGDFVLQSPLVLGHEASGIVTAVPSSSTNGEVSHATITPTTSTSSPATLKPGDRIALEVGIPCRICPLCTNGRYNLCPNLTFKSSAKTFPHADGTLQTIITHPANLCHLLPDNVTFEQGALVEPLSVVLHAINRSQAGGGSGPSSTPIPGSSILIMGAGAIGLLTGAALSVMGATKIVIADIDAGRLEVATNLSKSNPNIKLIPYLLPIPAKLSSASPPDPSTTISQSQSTTTTLLSTLSQPTSFSRVFECTGIPSAIQTSIFAASPGGKVILVGMGNPIVTLPLAAAALREVDLIGTFRYANCYPQAIGLFASGKLEGVAEGLVTHRVRLGEEGGGERAFGLAAGGKGLEGVSGKEGRVPVKVMVVP